jgi:hypothetical protein
MKKQLLKTLDEKKVMNFTLYDVNKNFVQSRNENKSF